MNLCPREDLIALGPIKNIYIIDTKPNNAMQIAFPLYYKASFVDLNNKLKG